MFVPFEPSPHFATLFIVVDTAELSSTKMGQIRCWDIPVINSSSDYWLDQNSLTRQRISGIFRISNLSPPNYSQYTWLRITQWGASIFWFRRMNSGDVRHSDLHFLNELFFDWRGFLNVQDPFSSIFEDGIS